MKQGLIYVSILVLTVVVLALVNCGGAGEMGENAATLEAEAGHEGHNHGPGQHGKTASLPTEEKPLLDWCYEHSVPESQCTKCNPGLIEQFKATGDWCVGHALPESHCRLCNPGIRFEQEEILSAQARERADHGIAVSLLFRPNTPVCATNDALIQFASAETAERAGLTTHQVRSDSRESHIEAPAEIVFNETASTVVTTTVPALVSRWMVSPGEVVREGEVIAIAQSPDIAELEAKLLSAHAANEVQQKEVERHEQLKARDLISDSDYEQNIALGASTRAVYISSRGLLKSAGLSETDIDDIITYQKISNQFALRAPTDGIMVDRIARIGELMEAGRAFAILANPTAMWIEARLTEEQLRHVELDQTLTFSSDGRGLSQVGGRIIWISRFLDPHSRTGTVRAEVVDPAHRLNAGEFGRVRIVERDDNRVTLVPKDAIQWEGCCNVVFVKETIDRYRPRKVDLTDGAGPYYQVLNGLEPGEEVVVDGAFLLKTELKKSSIGAGCCGIEPAG
jgi:cobalt-zinc-cadmium efflux system membrane fusion protein